jgi:catechol 2,3-dioxygenase-like lactoylglutathione lyase family enzyme
LNRCRRTVLLATLFWAWWPAHAAEPPDIIASNAFYYYDDVDAAWVFYRDTLGFETAADYGFAKIMRLADSSFVTLVRASEGMHSTDEPKTVLLTLQTENLPAWLDRLEQAGVPLMDDPADHRSVLFEDTGGYLLRLEETATLSTGSRRSSPHVQATIYTLYVPAIADVRDFYEGLFARRPVRSGATELIYSVSSTGYVALQEGSDGRLRPTAQSAVTLSFLTNDVDGWYERAKGWPGFELRTPDVLNEGGLVRVFVGYDPVGTFLEWDTFLPVEDNARLLKGLPR